MCILLVAVLVGTISTQRRPSSHDILRLIILLIREKKEGDKNHKIHVWGLKQNKMLILFLICLFCETGCPQITFGLQILKLVFEEYLFPKDLF